MQRSSGVVPSALKPPRPPSKNKTVAMVTIIQKDSCFVDEKGDKVVWGMCNAETAVHLVPVVLLACILILYICSSAQFLVPEKSVKTQGCKAFYVGSLSVDLLRVESKPHCNDCIFACHTLHLNILTDSLKYEMLSDETSRNVVEMTMMTERHLQQAVSSKLQAEEQTLSRDVFPLGILEKTNMDLQDHPSDLPANPLMLRGFAS